MTRTIQHCGYIVRFGFRNDRWAAHVLKPGGLLIIKDGSVTATADQGEAVLLERARARIDQERRTRPV